jgi:DNA-binding Lrp family transcriptional regulator
MGYIAIQIESNYTYYSKGANKLSQKIGCNATTITKNIKKVGQSKIIKGYKVIRCEDLINNNRGSSVLRNKMHY